MLTKASLSLCLLFSITTIKANANENEYRGDIRQSPVLYQLPTRGTEPSRRHPYSLEPKFENFGAAPRQGFRLTSQVHDQEQENDEDLDRNSTVSPPVLYYQQFQRPQQQTLQFRPTSPLPPVSYQQPITSAQVLPQQALALKPRPSQQEFQQFRRPANVKNQFVQQQSVEEEPSEEKEEKDRLTELLPQSKFNCNGKKSGYYADDKLNCEVFHYCQDNARHSWICPEGFSFHQVHLICMPPSSDNICQKSSQFHFVNDFLYRPLNIEEAQSRPNVTIRYGDRYYPETYYETNAPADEESDESARHFQQRPALVHQHATPSRSRPTQSEQHRQIQFVQQPQHLQQQQPSPPSFQSSVTPLGQHPQYFARQPTNFNTQAVHSSEEINIPHQSRRPITASVLPSRGGPAPTQSTSYEYE